MRQAFVHGMSFDTAPLGAESQPTQQLLIDGVAGGNVRLTVTKL